MPLPLPPAGGRLSAPPLPGRRPEAEPGLATRTPDFPDEHSTSGPVKERL